MAKSNGRRPPRRSRRGGLSNFQILAAFAAVVLLLTFIVAVFMPGRSTTPAAGQNQQQNPSRQANPNDGTFMTLGQNESVLLTTPEGNEVVLSVDADGNPYFTPSGACKLGEGPNPFLSCLGEANVAVLDKVPGVPMWSVWASPGTHLSVPLAPGG